MTGATYASRPSILSYSRLPLRLTLSHDLGQEPGAALGLVDPVLNQTGCSYIVVLFAQLVRGTQVSRQLLIVSAKLGQHVLRGHAFSVIVLQALMLRDIADRPDRSSADFARPLSDVVGHREDSSTVLIEQEVVIAEVPAAHVPVEVLRLDVEREHVGEQFMKLASNLHHGVAAEVDL